ncbi:delta-60 repeat domain-containing protein [Pseudomonas viridiflava]|uniref:delta-60 repeat domain-containing protein n=1 Tax=Pseudomonas viridiflava TaxID=33069 RepID=UPI000F0719B9|nr:delta-60 repeat domain-containing protein [Pseudomonas viridiflava]
MSHQDKQSKGPLLDTGFGEGGISRLDALGTGIVYAVEQRSDEKIISCFSDASQCGLVCLSDAGKLDTSYADSGYIIPQFDASNFAWVFNQVITLPDEKYLLCPVAHGASALGLARVDKSGKLDSTFGGNQNGFIVQYLPLESQGKAGSASTPVRPDPPVEPEAGVLHAAMSQQAAASSSSHLSDSGIIVYATLQNFPDAYVLKYTDQGALDASFGDGGVTTIRHTSSNGLAGLRGQLALKDGKHLIWGSMQEPVEGRYASTGFIARLNANGSVDTGYGAAGYLMFNPASDEDATVRYIVNLRPDNDGGYWGYGNASSTDISSYRGALFKLNADGLPDSQFNGGRPLFYSINESATLLYSIEIDSLKRLIIGGSFWQGTNNGAGFIARLLPDGNADTSFTDSGWAKSGMGNQDRITFVKLHDDRTLLVGGNVDISSPVVARFTLPS